MLNKPLRFESTVIETKVICENFSHIRLSIPPEFVFNAGQFVQLRIVLDDGSEIKNAYSIASAPNKKGYIELCVKLVSKGSGGSKQIHNLSVGSKVNIYGPMGKYSISNINVDLCFISAGAGIAPHRGMISQLLNEESSQKRYSNKIFVFSGVKSKKEEPYADEFRLWQSKNNEIYYMPVYSQEEDIKHNHVQDVILNLLPKDYDGDFYICGMYSMIQEVERLLLANGVQANRINYERYD